MLTTFYIAPDDPPVLGPKKLGFIGGPSIGSGLEWINSKSFSITVNSPFSVLIVTLSAEKAVDVDPLLLPLIH